MGILLCVLFFTLSSPEKKKFLISLSAAVLYALPMLILLGYSFYLWGAREQIELAPFRKLIVDLYHLRLWWHLTPTQWSIKIFAAYSFFIVAFVVSLKRASSRHKREIMLITFTILGMCIVGFVFGELIPLIPVMKLHLFRSMKFWAILAFLSMGALGIRVMEKQKNGIRILYVVLLVAALALFGNRQLRPGPSDEGWEDMCVWVKDNLPLDAKILTPPYIIGFRITALRSPYVEWKDGSALLWNPRWAVRVWWERISRISPNLLQVSPRQAVDSLRYDYEMIDPETVRLTGCGYYITTRGKTEFELIANKGSWFIYKVQ
jgi:hypothetical protein